MRYVLLFALVIISIILQTTMFDFLKVAGAKPDLVLIIVVIYSLIKGSKKGALFGFCAGLLIDFTTTSFIGLNALTKMILGYLVGFGETNLFRENLIIPVLGVFTASLTNEFLLYLLHSWYGYENGLIAAFSNIAFPVAVYNTALIPIFFIMFHKFLMRFF